MSDKPTFYNVNEVADILRLSDQTIRRYIKKGILKASKLGRNWIVQKEDLEEFIKNGTSE